MERALHFTTPVLTHVPDIKKHIFKKQPISIYSSSSSATQGETLRCDVTGAGGARPTRVDPSVREHSIIIY